MGEATLVDLPEAARLLRRSPDAIRRVLRRHPGIEARITRRWGRRLLSPADIKAIRAAFDEREARHLAAK